MTRKEALELANRLSPELLIHERLVDTLIVLGILKLDEPKSERERIREALQHLASVSVTNLLDPDVFYATAYRAGLKIVER